MGKEQVYSICGMCTVRCPIMTEVENGEVSFIQGNPHASGIEGSICARGAAGLRQAGRREVALGELGRGA